MYNERCSNERTFVGQSILIFNIYIVYNQRC